MFKYTFLLGCILLFSGCDLTQDSNTITSDTTTQDDNTTTDTTDTTTDTTDTTAVSTSSTNDSYVASIPDDSVVNPDIQQAPPYKPSTPMLTLLVSYNNIQISSDASAWSQKMYGFEPHQLNNYYQEISTQRFEFVKAQESQGTNNDGIMNVSLPYNHPDTAVDDSSFNANAYPDLKDALVAIDGYIDFSNYDSDANGAITPDELLLTFIIAGYEDSYEGAHVTNGIWAHQYCMSDPDNVPTLDGVRLMDCRADGNFALFGERHDIADPHDATIGIIAHELGHSAFALPDLYNTQASYGGIGFFGLMGAGTWAMQESDIYPGNTPTHMTPWSKMFNGWLTPQEESGSTTLNASSSQSYNIIKIPISANQYYLVENRANSGYDKGLYSLYGDFNGGVAIWKINENKLTTDYFNYNTVNADTDDKAVDLVEATTTFPRAYIDYGGSGEEKNLFYDTNVNAFGDKVTDISARGESMSLIIN